jgi:hypothetical protein
LSLPLFVCGYFRKMDFQKTPKNPKIYICETCDFKCCNKKDYTRHLLTAKHQRTYTDLQRTYKRTYIDDSKKNINVFVCDCGMEYKHRQSLNKHKQITCSEKPQKTPKNPKNPKNANSLSPPENIVHESISEARYMNCFQMMMDQNAAHAEQTAAHAEQTVAQTAAQNAAHAEQTAAQNAAYAEQSRLLIETISLNGPQTITNNNNTTNNQFNLNVFLNEDCKNAYTLKEVIDSIECTVADLDRMDTDGYAATVTRKILESIQNMSITERPIHCTDARRNAVCVKNETGWDKSETALKSLNDTVYIVGRKLNNVVPAWREAYPDHFRGTVSRRNQYHRLITNILKVSDLKVEAKIAGVVCKGVILDRKTAASA